MRVLLLNVNGVSGSTGKIVTDIKKVLEGKGHDCMVCYGANDNIKDNGYIRICPEFERRTNALISRTTGVLHGKFTPFSFFRLKKIVNEWQPDIVHIHCPNGYTIDLFKTLKYLAESKIKTVLTNHAEFYYTGGCGHAFDCNKWLTGCHDCARIKSKIGLDAPKIEWNEFKNAFDLFDEDKLIVTSVSPWVASRAQKSLALSRFKNVVVLNGVDTDIFRLREVSLSVREKLPKGKPIVLHVTASFSSDKNSIKGGRYIIELAKQMPDINFVVACSYCHNTHEMPNNLIIWGRAANQIELAELYNAANLTVITSKKETFSMIVAESLCCGTPIVGFEAGGPESIAIPEYSMFTGSGKIHELKEYVNRLCILKRNNDTLSISLQAKRKYSKEVMTMEYINLYKRML